MPQAAEGEYEVRLLPPPALERPITAEFRVDPPISERERIEMNEPELIRAAAATGGKFYTPLDGRDAAQGPSPALEGPPGHRSAHPALEHLARAGPVPDADHGGMGFPETQADGIIFVRLIGGGDEAARSPGQEADLG